MKKMEGIMEYQKGDIIALNTEATIGDMIANKWKGCQIDTLEFIRFAYEGETFVVEDLDDIGNVIVETPPNSDNVVNPAVIKLVERPSKKVTIELTQEQLDKIKESGLLK